MKPHIQPHPNFDRFLDTLLLRKAWRRPPVFDFFPGRGHMQRILGRAPETAADRIEFYRIMGYDYVQCSLYVPMEELNQARQQQQREGNAVSHGGSLGVIRSLEHFRSHQWSWQPLADGDFSNAHSQQQLKLLSETMAALPPGMKILLHTADVYTFAWEMIGFDEFAMMTLEEPQCIAEVMGSLAAATLNLFREGLKRAGRSIGAIMYSDDIAYTEGLFLSPDFFRGSLFPVIGKLAALGREVDAPLIYHSDGKLYPVFDVLREMGVRAIQPLEPKAMDPLEIKRRWPGQFCLLGNIDLDLMTRGSTADVERHVRDRIDKLNATGGYMPGISNTVPDYVSTDNYVKMIETIYSYPDEQVA